MASGSRSGSYQVAAKRSASRDHVAADRLDRLNGHAVVCAHGRELLEVGEVSRVLRHGEVVGQQD